MCRGGTWVNRSGLSSPRRGCGNEGVVGGGLEARAHSDWCPSEQCQKTTVGRGGPVPAQTETVETKRPYRVPSPK